MSHFPSVRLVAVCDGGKLLHLTPPGMKQSQSQDTQSQSADDNLLNQDARMVYQEVLVETAADNIPARADSLAPDDAEQTQVTLSRHTGSAASALLHGGQINQKTVLILGTHEGTVECDVCKRMLKDMSSLKAHKLTHTEERPFTCDWLGCEDSFKTKGSLKRHMRRHTGDRPFVCELCNRSFRESGALTRHQKSRVPCIRKSDADLPMYGKRRQFNGKFEEFVQESETTQDQESSTTISQANRNKNKKTAECIQSTSTQVIKVKSEPTVTQETTEQQLTDNTSTVSPHDKLKQQSSASPNDKLIQQPPMALPHDKLIQQSPMTSPHDKLKQQSPMASPHDKLKQQSPALVVHLPKSIDLKRVRIIKLLKRPANCDSNLNCIIRVGPASKKPMAHASQDTHCTGSEKQIGRGLECQTVHFENVIETPAQVEDTDDCVGDTLSGVTMNTVVEHIAENDIGMRSSGNENITAGHGSSHKDTSMLLGDTPALFFTRGTESVSNTCCENIGRGREVKIEASDGEVELMQSDLSRTDTDDEQTDLQFIDAPDIGLASIDLNTTESNEEADINSEEIDINSEQIDINTEHIIDINIEPRDSNRLQSDLSTAHERNASESTESDSSQTDTDDESSQMLHSPPDKCKRKHAVTKSNNNIAKKRKMNVKTESGEISLVLTESDDIIEENAEEVVTSQNAEELMTSHEGTESHVDAVRKPDDSPLDNSYRCQACGKITNGDGEIKDHLKTHLKSVGYRCAVQGCRCIVSDSAALYTHLEVVHRITPDDDNTRFEDDTPGYVDTKTAQVALKQLLELQGNLDTVVDSVGRQTVKVLHSCPVCARAFTLAYLKLHIRSHTGERPHKCAHCGKRFRTPDTLNKHLSSHSNLRTFKCGECNKTFKRISHVREHLKVHSNERQYPCTMCEKSFKSANACKVHMRTHQDIFPHNCSVCKKTFREKGALERHIRSHTGEKPYVCKKCGRGFAEHGTLGRHMRAKVPCTSSLNYNKYKQTVDAKQTLAVARDDNTTTFHVQPMIQAGQELVHFIQTTQQPSDVITLSMEPTLLPGHLAPAGVDTSMLRAVRIDDFDNMSINNNRGSRNVMIQGHVMHQGPVDVMVQGTGDVMHQGQGHVMHQGPVDVMVENDDSVLAEFSAVVADAPAYVVDAPAYVVDGAGNHVQVVEISADKQQEIESSLYDVTSVDPCESQFIAVDGSTDMVLQNNEQHYIIDT